MFEVQRTSRSFTDALPDKQDNRPSCSPLHGLSSFLLLALGTAFSSTLERAGPHAKSKDALRIAWLSIVPLSHEKERKLRWGGGTLFDSQAYPVVHLMQAFISWSPKNSSGLRSPSYSTIVRRRFVRCELHEKWWKDVASLRKVVMMEGELWVNLKWAIGS